MVEGLGARPPAGVQGAAPPGRAGLILITRPEPAASQTAARLHARGHPTLLAPMLDIAEIAADLPDPSTIQAVLVTSANALDRLPDTFFDRPLLAVGNATAARARARGFHSVRSADADAAALAALAAQCCDPAGAKLLVAHGAGQADALAALLQQAGFTLSRAVLYAATQAARLPPHADAAWRAGAIATALFFSAETARAFVALIEAADIAQAARSVAAIAIAAPAAAALAPLPWASLRVALHPDQDTMLALL